MIDLSELQSRVDAAKSHYDDQAEQRGKLVLRLNDLAFIVEGSLLKQRKALEEAGRQIGKLSSENEQLRGMVLTLLNVIEGRSRDNIQEIMHRLDHSVRTMMLDHVPREKLWEFGSHPAGEEGGLSVISLRR